MSKLVFYLEKKIAALFLRCLRLTQRFEIINRNPDDQRCIYLFWHRNLLLLAIHRMGDPIAIMVSPSKDGELIAGPASELGYIAIRGSSSRKGSQALKEMIEKSADRQLAITPDGPKGPPQKIKHGIFQIALLGDIPIIPVVADTNREWVFNSWDRFRVPKPFAKIKVIYGRPYQVKDRASFEELDQEISEYIKRLEADL